MKIEQKGLNVWTHGTGDFGTGVRIESNGRMVATDGHRLAVYDPKAIQEVTAENPALEPATIDCKDAKQLAAATRKAETVCVDTAESNANGEVKFTHHSSGGDGTVRLEKTAGAFPAYKGKIPPKGENAIGLDVRYLRDACDLILKTCLGENRKDQVCVRIDVAEEERDCKPVRLEASNEDGTMTIVIMPMKLVAVAM